MQYYRACPNTRDMGAHTPIDAIASPKQGQMSGISQLSKEQESTTYGIRFALWVFFEVRHFRLLKAAFVKFWCVSGA